MFCPIRFSSLWALWNLICSTGHPSVGENEETRELEPFASTLALVLFCFESYITYTSGLILLISLLHDTYIYVKELSGWFSCGWVGGAGLRLRLLEFGEGEIKWNLVYGWDNRERERSYHYELKSKWKIRCEGSGKAESNGIISDTAPDSSPKKSDFPKIESGWKVTTLKITRQGRMSCAFLKIQPHHLSSTHPRLSLILKSRIKPTSKREKSAACYLLD